MKMFGLSGISVAMLAALTGTVHSQVMSIDGDMVRGAINGAQGGAVIDYNPDGSPICVLTNQFKHREKVVFRFRIRDQTGKTVENDGLSSLVVELPDGERLQARFGPHPPRTPTDYFWTAVWDIPASYPTGTLTYKAIATDKSGRQHSWAPINRVTSQLQVLPGDVTAK